MQKKIVLTREDIKMAQVDTAASSQIHELLLANAHRLFS